MDFGDAFSIERTSKGFRRWLARNYFEAIGRIAKCAFLVYRCLAQRG